MNSCGILFLAPILGAIAGYLFAFLLFSGWFIAWQAVSPPPEKAAQILALHAGQVWVQTTSGSIYLQDGSQACSQNCWERVDAQPPTFPVETGIPSIQPQACKPVPPLLGARQVIGECQRDTWTDCNVAYALRMDGSLAAWHFTSGGEYELLGNFMTVVIGAVAFFIVGLIFVLANRSKNM
jgi:hypothetical protein